MSHWHRSTTTANFSFAFSKTTVNNNLIHPTTLTLTLHNLILNPLPTISLLIPPSPPSDPLFRSTFRRTTTTTTTTMSLALLCPRSLSLPKTLTSSFKGFRKTLPGPQTTNPLRLIRRRFSPLLTSISISSGSAKNNPTRSCLVISLSLILIFLVQIKKS